MLQEKEMINSVRMACNWLFQVAQVKTKALPTNISTDFSYDSWRGALRGEYSVKEKKWGFFCPVWHTGQAVKSAVMAAEVLGEEYLEAAKMGADFIFSNQIWDETNPDHGLILAYEDMHDKVNTSAVLECMDGLMMLADRLKSEVIWERIIAAGYFLIDKIYMAGLGLFRDVYDPDKHDVILPNPYRTKDNAGGRPLLDDGILLKLFRKTQDERFRKIHLEISEKLLVDQNPAGNWIDYAPCNNRDGNFHPRHNYWWGLPLIDTYRETKRQEFLDTAIDSGKFCEKAMRKDGGWFRGFYVDGKTDCFGHATSGSACAAILWLELFKETGDSHWKNLAEKALEYCIKMQFVNPEDANLKGAILEKVLPPDGSDQSPYWIRDLGTIFYIVAALKFLHA